MKIENEKILVLFSGGRTSGFLAKVAKEVYSKNNEVVFVFANTGKEKEETLEFVDKCDKEFGLNLIWIEAVINQEKGIGVEYKIVDFETANRNGSIFESLIRKFGLPSKLLRHCTRDLKERPMNKLGFDILGKGFKKMIGIRADEPHRFPKSKDIIAPLIQMGVNEKLIRDWWKRQSFDLNLKDYQGNCDLCFLKSKRKRLTIVSENEELTEWWHDKEQRFATDFQPMFDVRNNLTIFDLVEMAKQPFEKQLDKDEERQKKPSFDFDLDFDIDCFCKG